MTKSPSIEITYCKLCGWGLRAGWMAQELLATFAEELGSVTLTPDVTGGFFEICLDGEMIWSRKDKGRFPEIKEIKRLVRLRQVPFIRPMAPTLAKTPPAGPEWLHEVKFDGWRAQVHIEAGAATLYSKNGADITRRFRSLRPALARVRALIDCVLVACDETGMPSFRSLMNLGTF